VKYTLNDGKIAFVTHIVTYGDEGKQININCFSITHKDTISNILNGKDIVFTVETVDQPSPEIVARCAGKIFSSYSEAEDFMSTGEVPLTEVETIALAVAELYEMMSGGAV